MFALLILIGLGALAYLLSPIGLFFYYIADITEPGAWYAPEISAFSHLSVGEKSDKEKDDLLSQITIAIPEEAVEATLRETLTAKALPCISIERVQTDISPEMMSVDLLAQCQVFHWPVSEFHIVTEWQAQANPNVPGEEGTSLALIKPLDIRTNYLSSINWTRIWNPVWKYIFRTETYDGWLDISSALGTADIQELLLQDREILLNVRL